VTAFLAVSEVGDASGTVIIWRELDPVLPENRRTEAGADDAWKAWLPRQRNI
jgi:hypothetical protein